MSDYKPFKERGPVDTLSWDDALLSESGNPSKFEGTAPIDWSPDAEPFEYQPMLVEQAGDYIVRHPLTTTVMLGTAVANPDKGLLPTLMAWSPDLGEALSAVLPETGSPYEFLEHMDEHPEDWYHLFGFGTRLNDMIANPEDYNE